MERKVRKDRKGRDRHVYMKRRDERHMDRQAEGRNLGRTKYKSGAFAPNAYLHRLTLLSAHPR